MKICDNCPERFAIVYADQTGWFQYCRICFVITQNYCPICGHRFCEENCNEQTETRNANEIAESPTIILRSGSHYGY